jgi:hypothetical protein
LRHQPADEMHVTAQPIQLGNLGQRRGELRPTAKRCKCSIVALQRALTGLDLGELGRNRVAFALNRLRVRSALQRTMT